MFIAGANYSKAGAGMAPATKIGKPISKEDREAFLKIIQALIREKIIPFVIKGDDLIFSVFFGNAKIHVKKVKLTLLGRCFNFSDVFFQKEDKIYPVNTLEKFLDYLYYYVQNLTSKSLWDRFIREMRNHKDNAKKTSKNINFRNSQIYEAAKQVNASSVLNWVAQNNSILDKSLYLEQFFSKGHPIHPCSKTKLGFTSEDIFNYSSEFNPIVKLNILALHHTLINISMSNSFEKNYKQYFSSSFSREYNQWENELIKNKLNINEYLPIPAHPWQVENVIKNKFQYFIDNKLLIIYKNAYIEASPTLSFRTLKPIRNQQAPYIKLPIAIQATSVFRTLSHFSVINAPIISDFLQEIFEREKNFNGKLKMLPEICGAYIDTTPSEDAKHFSVIFRESVDKNLETGEISIVVASLFEPTPTSKLPLLIEEMKLSNVIKVHEAIIYFKKYAELIISSYLDLYLIYGIALEGHQQNTFAVFESGMIKYFIARDLDGVDIDEVIFKQAYPKSKGLENIFSKYPKARNSLLHTVFQSHLGEVIILISTYFACDEIRLWDIVAQLTHERFIFLQTKVDKSRWKKEYKAILLEPWNCKALLRMRLMEEYNRDGLFMEITNPLSAYIERNYPDVE